MPSREVRGSHIQNLPLRDECLHRLPDLFPGRVAIYMVHLVEVNMICLQSFERTFHSLTNIQSRETGLIRPFPHASINLCRNDCLVAPATTLRKPTTDDLLGYSLPELP